MAQAFVIQCKETISDNILLQHHVKILTVDLLAKHMNYVNVVYKIASKCSDIAVKDVKTLFYPKRRFCVPEKNFKITYTNLSAIDIVKRSSGIYLHMVKNG